MFPDVPNVAVVRVHVYPYNVPGNKIVFPNILNVVVVRLHVHPRNVPANIECSPTFPQAVKKEKKEKREAAFLARKATLLASHQGSRQDPPIPKTPRSRRDPRC